MVSDELQLSLLFFFSCGNDCAVLKNIYNLQKKNGICNEYAIFRELNMVFCTVEKYVIIVIAQYFHMGEKSGG